MFVKKGNSFLPDFSLKEIERRYKEEKNVKAKIRLQCALLRKKSKSQPYISDATNLAITTVSEILRRFEKRGLSGCYALKQKGKIAYLSKEQKEELKQILIQPPYKQELPFKIWTAKVLAYFIEIKYQVVFKIRAVEKLVHELGFNFKKARPEHKKANKQLQEIFKKTSFFKLPRSLNVDGRSYFLTKVSSK